MKPQPRTRLTVAKIKASVKKTGIPATVRKAWWKNVPNTYTLSCGCPMLVFAVAELGYKPDDNERYCGYKLKDVVGKYFGHEYVTTFLSAFDSRINRPTPAYAANSSRTKAGWADGVAAAIALRAGEFNQVVKKGKK